MKQVKITVIKTEVKEDLIKEYAMDGLDACSVMKEGQVFYADRACPKGFCDTAWRCIHQYVFALANGGGREGFCYNDWVKEPGVAISCCNDGLRPVYFKLEATDMDSVKDI